MEICICCQNKTTNKETTVTSLYLSRVAWGGKPEITNMISCNTCGFRSYTRMLTDTEYSNYYNNYRDHNYVKERHRDEIFYTNIKFKQDEDWMSSPVRQSSLAEILNHYVSNPGSIRILDYGGGDGMMISKLETPNKFVYDISRIPPVPGIKTYDPTKKQEHPKLFDVIVCAQTLEHISRVDIFMQNMIEILNNNGFIYIELPIQRWRNFSFGHTKIHNWVILLAKRNRLFHKLFDTYSTIFRVKFKILPPFGFVPMREHVNFFTDIAIIKLGERLGLKTAYSGVHPFCGIQVLFKKSNM